MDRYRKKLVCFSFVFLISNASFAKGAAFVSKYCKYWHINLTVGSGLTFYKIVTKAMLVPDIDGKLYLLQQAEESRQRYLINWYHGPYVHVPALDQRPQLDKKLPLVVVFKGIGYAFPILLSTHIDCSKLRFGVGIGFGINTLKKLAATAPAHTSKETKPLVTYYPPKNVYYTLNPLFMVGYQAKESATYTSIVEVQWAPIFSYANLAHRVYCNAKWLHYTVGLTVERHIATYCKLVSRLAYNMLLDQDNLSQSKSTATKNTATKSTSPVSIIHKQEGLLLHFGISINYPELPRCQVRSCKVKGKHRHAGNAYQGRSIFDKTVR